MLSLVDVVNDDRFYIALSSRLTALACDSAVDVEVLLNVHRNRRFIRDGNPGRPPRLSHSS